MKKAAIVPLVIFAILLGFLVRGLGLKPHEIPSPLINKPAPAFSLPLLDAPEQRLSTQDMRGQVWILNVWASWCVACRIEHPLLVEFSKTGAVPIYGLN
ncbi:MAG: redoxin family protein, partial [Rhodoferax sp.]|nr:redoxin family protein [Rhodoferax sp.]